MIKEETLNQILVRMKESDTFVLNIVADWCPDCTEEQSQFIEQFQADLQEVGLSLIQLTAQIEKRVYISLEMEKFITSVGGHGFPRTILIVGGKVVDHDNVEMITSAQLKLLVKRFERLL